MDPHRSDVDTGRPIRGDSFAVQPVRTRADLRCFAALPRQLNASNPGWIEPLRFDQHQLLDRKRHPFYTDGEGAEAEFFLARDPSGRPVGRIAAILDHRHEAFVRARQPDAPRAGAFGFFECVNEPEVAKALVDAAAQWLRARDAASMLGPASPSQNYEYGVLVAGHGEPHRFLLAAQPVYLSGLLEGAGLHKAKDLVSLSFDLFDRERMPRIERGLATVEAWHQRHGRGVTVRHIHVKKLREEIKLGIELFNRVLHDHWGHAPMSQRELELITESLRFVIIPELFLFAERDGKPIGIAIAVPDLNEVIPRLRFRFGILELLELVARVKLRRMECARVLLFGIDRDGDTTGVTALLLAQLVRSIRDRGLRYIDTHWILEDNLAMLAPVMRFGFRKDRVYRIYEKAL